MTANNGTERSRRLARVYEILERYGAEILARRAQEDASQDSPGETTLPLVTATASNVPARKELGTDAQ